VSFAVAYFGYAVHSRTLPRAQKEEIMTEFHVASRSIVL